MTDLTERLAAKLGTANVSGNGGWLIAHDAPILLPLLLSEPELVAGLPEKVRVAALQSLLKAAPVMESAFVDAAEVLALAPEELRLSVLTPMEREQLRHGKSALAKAAFTQEETDD